MKTLTFAALVAILPLQLTACRSGASQHEQGPYGSRIESLESNACDTPQNYSTRAPYREQRERPRSRPHTRDSYDDQNIESFHMTLGVGQLNDDDYWRDLDEPWFFGIDYASSNPGNGLGGEIGFLFWGDSTGNSSSDEEISAAEIFAGLRFTVDPGRSGPHPYIGLGGTLIGAKLEGPGYDENDASIGLYGHAGLTIPMGSSMEIGLDYRIVRGTDADFPGGAESDFDYDRLALVVGWMF